MLKKMILGTIVFALCVMPVIAAEKQGKKAVEEDPCSSGGAVKLRICAEKRLEDADKRLNQVYQKLKSRIDTLFDKEENKISKDLLIKAQRAWIEFRNAECGVSGQFERYGAAPQWKETSSVFCKEKMTKKRIIELENYTKELNEK